jgi:hypothetical protein
MTLMLNNCLSFRHRKALLNAPRGWRNRSISFAWPEDKRQIISGWEIGELLKILGAGDWVSIRPLASRMAPSTHTRTQSRGHCSPAWLLVCTFEPADTVDPLPASHGAPKIYLDCIVGQYQCSSALESGDSAVVSATSPTTAIHRPVIFWSRDASASHADLDAANSVRRVFDSR